MVLNKLINEKRKTLDFLTQQ